MNPENLEKHFTYMSAVFIMNGINDPSWGLNLDESDFSSNRMTLGRSKFFLRNHTRDNIREEMFRGTINDVTLMKVVSQLNVYTDIFLNWVQNFVAETVLLRRDGKKVLFMEDYSSHISYKTLSL